MRDALESRLAFSWAGGVELPSTSDWLPSQTQHQEPQRKISEPVVRNRMRSSLVWPTTAVRFRPTLFYSPPPKLCLLI
jgi:hypothetical protein